MKVSVAARAASEASMRPQVLAITRTNSRYAKPVVVGFSGIRRDAVIVINATPASANTTRQVIRAKFRFTPG